MVLKVCNTDNHIIFSLCLELQIQIKTDLVTFLIQVMLLSYYSKDPALTAQTWLVLA